MIIKQVTTSQFTSGEEEETSHRLLNEWATLEFLAALPKTGPWPELVAANRDESFVVLGDLGRHPNVEEILLSGSPIQGVDALRHLGESLGRFHAAARADFPVHFDQGRTRRFCAQV